MTEAGTGTRPGADDATVDVTADLREPRPRIAVRRRLPSGEVTDVVGLDVDGTRGRPVPGPADVGVAVLRVLPDDGPLEVVPAADVVAARVVPARAVRPASSPAAIERLAARGWPGVEHARLGGWLLRAGLGWTGRANSALAVGDPGMPLDRAVAAVEAFYVDRGLTPRVQVVTDLDLVGGPGGLGVGAAERAGGSVDDHLAGRGWTAGDATVVLVADLRRVPHSSQPDEAADGPDAGRSLLDTRWADRPEGDWFSLYRGGITADATRATTVLTAVDAHYLTLRRDGWPVAVARLVVTDDWAGLAGLEVAPHARRQGLGAHAVRLAFARARELGARFAYAQTLRDNHASRALLSAAGMSDHHGYHYRTPSPG